VNATVSSEVSDGGRSGAGNDIEMIYDHKVRKVLRKYLKFSRVGTRRKQAVGEGSTADDVVKLD
jgi:hypothetical protein